MQGGDVEWESYAALSLPTYVACVAGHGAPLRRTLLKAEDRRAGHCATAGLGNPLATQSLSAAVKRKRA